MIEIAGAPKELVQPRVAPAGAAPVGPVPAIAPELRAACLAVLRGRWASLAVVSTAPSAAGQRVATALAELARAYRLRPVRTLDGAGADAARIATLQEELAGALASEARLVVTVEDARTNPAVVPVLAQVDAALLVVPLGSSALATVEESAAL